MLGTGARGHVRRWLSARGVEVVEHERVVAVDRDEIVLGSGASLASDLTLWSGGFEAAPLAREAGLVVDELGRAIVDRRLRAVGHDFVHVIGDAARAEVVREDGTRAPLRMSCAAALPMGAFAADDIARKVNGEPGLVLRAGDETFGVVTLGVTNDAITDVFVVLNPEKLARAAI